MNLLEETKNDIELEGHTVDDVIWVGSKDGTLAITWAQFEQLANFEYDDGFGSEEIAKDLVVVGDNWWLERHDYDGSEWWEYKTMPIKASNAVIFSTVSNHGESYIQKLGELNDTEA